MRPDAILWKNTRDMVSLESNPKQTLKRDLIKLLVGGILFQFLLGGILSYGFQAWGKDVVIEWGVDQSQAELLLLFGGHVAALLMTVLCVVPFVYLRLSRWSKGVSALVKGMRSFAASGKLNPVNVGSQDEIGYLCVAYNDMASRLLQSRTQLIKADEEMVRKVEQHVERRTKELVDTAERLREIVRIDQLTGLENSDQLAERLNRLFQVPLPEGDDIFCMLINLDGFIRVNDEHGREMGDEVLRVVSGLLKQTCRGTDMAVRYGGDRFILLLVLKNSKDAMSIANRLQNQFKDAMGVMFGSTDEESFPTLSFGVSGRKANVCKNSEELLHYADAALNEAKADRAGKVLFYEDEAA